MSKHDAAVDVTDEINAIKERFKQRLMDDCYTLTELSKSLSSDNFDESLKQIHRVLHAIAGSAGTFGFDNVTQQARQTDQILIKARGKKADTNTGRLILLAQDELTRFCDLLTDVSGYSERSHEHPQVHQSAGVTPDYNVNHDADVWLIEDDKQLADQLSEQLVNFNFNLKVIDLTRANELAQKIGWPSATIVDLDSSPFSVSDSFNSVFKESGSLPRGLIMLSESDEFEQRIKAAKVRAASFVKKPIDLPELVSQLETTVNEEVSEPPRVMLIDDDHDLRSLMKLELEEEGINVHIVEDVTKVLWEINEFRPELLLLDMEMPDYSGIDIALLVRQNIQFESLPIVYLSAELDLQKQTEALLFNADDFLVKPIPLERLISSIRSRVLRARRIENLISKDGLTGLYKHASIKEQAERELKRALRRNESISLVMLDIDFFKRVNDTYGHATGDTVIASLATLLRHRLRQTDIVGRYGGEEFLIVLPNTSEQHAFDVIENIRIAFSAIEFSSSNENFRCTLSAGTVCSDGMSVKNASELIEEADRALYASKRSGRNRQTVRSNL